MHFPMEECAQSLWRVTKLTGYVRHVVSRCELACSGECEKSVLLPKSRLHMPVVDSNAGLTVAAHAHAAVTGVPVHGGPCKQCLWQTALLTICLLSRAVPLWHWLQLSAACGSLPSEVKEAIDIVTHRR